MCNGKTVIFSILLLLFSVQVSAETDADVEGSEAKVEYTLWSDDKNCTNEDALLIAIESHGDSYKVAACAVYGCRIAVREFGKKSHLGNFREDPKFHWFSRDEFEAEINGQKKRLYLCLTK